MDGVSGSLNGGRRVDGFFRLVDILWLSCFEDSHLGGLSRRECNQRTVAEASFRSAEVGVMPGTRGRVGGEVSVGEIIRCFCSSSPAPQVYH